MELELSSVNSDSLINDIRLENEFKGLTFSKCSKTEVRKTLLLNISKGSIEASCHWCAELICAGHFMDVWEVILFYLGKNIHLGNPKLIIYLESRYNLFKSIVDKGNFTNILQLRNNETIRKLFAEIICLLSQSKTKHSFEPIKINIDEDFDVIYMTERLKAPSTDYIESIYQSGDPKKFYIAINEFSYCISRDKLDIIGATYWIEWIIEFECHCKKRKEKHVCERRNYIPVDAVYQKDVIWIVWDSIIYNGKEKDIFIQKLLSSLLNLFCIRYTISSCKKRRYLLYFAVSLLVENVQTNIDIVEDKNIVQTVTSQIDNVYKEIKKNEHSPKMDYLFSNIDQEHQNNAEKSIRKLQIMDNLH
jgi:hypothetical protein